MHLVASGSKMECARYKQNAIVVGYMKKKGELIRPLSYQQRRAKDIWLAGGRKSKAKAIREAGYSEAVARQPHKVFGSPAVKRELELRGYGERGIESSYALKKEVVTHKVVEVRHQIAFDPSQIPIEQIVWLKEKLAESSDTPKQPRSVLEQAEQTSYIPHGNGVDIFSAEAKWSDNNRPNLDNISSFSSM